MVQDDKPVGLGGRRVEFDDERVISDAGVMLFAMVPGADGIDDRGVLRAGRTRRLLGGWSPAPCELRERHDRAG